MTCNEFYKELKNCGEFFIQAGANQIRSKYGACPIIAVYRKVRTGNTLVGYFTNTQVDKAAKALKMSKLIAGTIIAAADNIESENEETQKRIKYHRSRLLSALDLQEIPWKKQQSL